MSREDEIESYGRIHNMQTGIRCWCHETHNPRPYVTGGTSTRKHGDYTVTVHDEGGDGDGYRLWAEVDGLPGVFASGRDEAELAEALDESIAAVTLDRNETESDR